MNTEHRQKKEILSIARRTGKLDGLYWYVRLGKKEAAYHGNPPVLPVVPVDQFGESEIWTDLIIGLLSHHNPRQKFWRDLTHLEALEGVNWYEWGSDEHIEGMEREIWIDAICPCCGAVHRQIKNTPLLSCSCPSQSANYAKPFA